MIGHLAEAGIVIHDEFRAGNIAPATANLEFIKACEARLPKGHAIAHVRLDSASYQADIFNYLDSTGLRHRRAPGCTDATGHCRHPGAGLETLP